MLKMYIRIEIVIVFGNRTFLGRGVILDLYRLLCLKINLECVKVFIEWDLNY